MSVADIDSEDDDKWLAHARSLTPAARNEWLMTAAGEGEAWRCEKLIELGADPHHDEGQPLKIAAAGGRMGVLNVLLAKNPPQEHRNAALVMAATAGRPEAVKLLLANNADATFQSQVTLLFAALQGQAEMAEALLRAGADVNGAGKSLMGVALSHRQDKVAEVFLRYGADIGALYQDRNAFEWAAEMHLEDFFQVLRKWAKGDEFMSPEYFRSKSLEELRGEMPERGGRTGFHLAAAAGAFDVIIDKLLSTPGEKMRREDLTRERPGGGPSVLLLLGQTNQLKPAFDPRLWAGRREEMLDTFGHVPGAYRNQVDIGGALNAVAQMALKANARKFTLKP